MVFFSEWKQTATLRATKGLPVAALNDDITGRQELPRLMKNGGFHEVSINGGYTSILSKMLGFSDFNGILSIFNYEEWWFNGIKNQQTWWF